MLPGCVRVWSELKLQSTYDLRGGRIMKLRILLADDHEIVRRGLRALLEK
jgi:hypothetical protein